MCPGPWTKYILHKVLWENKDLCILGCLVMTRKLFFLLGYEVFTLVSLLTFKVNK